MTVTMTTSSSASGAGGSGPANVLMTPAAIAAFGKLKPRQAESVARAIEAIGQVEGKPVEAPDDSGRKYLAMVPDDQDAPVVMYRVADDSGYLVTTLVDRATYKTYEKAERLPSFLSSTTFRTAAGAVAAAAIGAVLGSRASGRAS